MPRICASEAYIRTYINCADYNITHEMVGSHRLHGCACLFDPRAINKCVRMCSIWRYSLKLWKVVCKYRHVPLLFASQCWSHTHTHTHMHARLTLPKRDPPPVSASPKCRVSFWIHVRRIQSNLQQTFSERQEKNNHPQFPGNLHLHSPPVPISNRFVHVRV